MTGVSERHGPPSASARVAQPAECRRVAVELSQNMRPDREHMERA